MKIFMSVKLNHTIVYARDKSVSAAFLAGILGLPAPAPFGHFLTVRLDNEITLDFIDAGREFSPTHYAFLVSEKEFDEIFGRIRERRIPFWADPFHRQANEINTNDGGRGVYFEDPNGHNLEIITRPYGGGETPQKSGDIQ
jgi:catechol 2,3-dioxygenase-like lactoylglutathione lyase family enzyme